MSDSYVVRAEEALRAVCDKQMAVLRTEFNDHCLWLREIAGETRQTMGKYVYRFHASASGVMPLRNLQG